jgi:ankyrin repeat protein
MSIDKSEYLILEEICKAAFEGEISVLTRLLENKIDLNRVGKSWTPLHSAIENQNIECVKILINKGANVEYCGEDFMGSPLEHAIDIAIQSNNNTGGKEGDEQIEIIELLLEAGADPRTGIRIANSYQTNKIIKILNDTKSKNNNKSYLQ